MFSLNNLMTSRKREDAQAGWSRTEIFQALGEETYSRGKH